MKNKVNYLSIIKKAINITISNKILWLFGFLAIFSGAYSSHYTFPSNNSSNSEFNEMEYMNMLRRASFYWELYKEWIIFGVVVCIIILIGLYILGMIGRGALIDSIFKVIKKEAFSFSSGFRKGVHFLGRLFLTNLLFSLTFLVFVSILLFPVIRLFILKSYIAATSLGLFALVLLIFTAVLFFYFRRYAEMYLIGNDLSISSSIKLAYELFEKNIKESFIMGLILIGINMVIGISLVLIVLGFFIPSGILGFIIYKIVGESAIVIFIAIAIIVFVGVMLLVKSILNVFFEAVWILFFHELAKKKEDVNGLAEKEELGLNAKTEVEVIL